MYELICSGEQQSARLLIDGALKRNWTVSVFDGEEWALKRSTAPDAIIDAMGNTGEDNLTFRDADGKLVGRAMLVWGNSPVELVADHTLDDKGPFESFMDWHQQEVEAKRLN
jgi:hypothetical protein